MQDKMQTSGTKPEPSAAGRLLAPQERALLEGVAAGETQFSQWARALSAFDAGATQAEAAQSSGLTRGQVKYLLSKFRQRRLDIFPQHELSPVDEVPLASAPDMPAEAVSTLEPSTQPESQSELQEVHPQVKAAKASSKKEKGKSASGKSGGKKGAKARKKDAKKGKPSKKDKPAKKSKKDKKRGRKSKKKGKR